MSIRVLLWGFDGTIASRDRLWRAGDPEVVWMIGDNYEADVAGAEACGIRAILVRRPDPRAERYAENLSGIAALLGE